MGQLFESHILAAIQPIACIAEFERAIASAPRAMALTKSSGTRNPPVIINVTSLPTVLSRCLRALASAGMVGTDILSRKIKGAAPVPPPRPSPSVRFFYKYNKEKEKMV